MRKQQQWVRTIVWVTVGAMVLSLFAIVFSVLG
jgi:hypothetical protein